MPPFFNLKYESTYMIYPKISITEVAFHRNGICGAPFHVVLFKDTGDENIHKLAILFDDEHHCAVLDVKKLADGNIKFGSNSYRGDMFEKLLREYLKTNS